MAASAMPTSVSRMIIIIALIQSLGVQAFTQEGFRVDSETDYGKGATKNSHSGDGPCVDVVQMIREKFRNTLDKTDLLEDLAKATTSYGDADNLAGEAKAKLSAGLVEWTSSGTVNTAITDMYNSAIAKAALVMSNVVAGKITLATTLSNVNAIVNGDKVSQAISTAVSGEKTGSAQLHEDAKDVWQEVLDANTAASAAQSTSATTKTGEKAETLRLASAATLAAQTLVEGKTKEAGKCASDLTIKTNAFEDSVTDISTAQTVLVKCKAAAKYKSMNSLLGQATQAETVANIAKKKADDDAADAVEAKEKANDAKTAAQKAKSEADAAKGEADSRKKTDNDLAETERNKQQQDKSAAASAATTAATKAAARDQEILDISDKYSLDDLDAMREAARGSQASQAVTVTGKCEGNTDSGENVDCSGGDGTIATNSENKGSAVTGSTIADCCQAVTVTGKCGGNTASRENVDCSGGDGTTAANTENRGSSVTGSTTAACCQAAAVSSHPACGSHSISDGFQPPRTCNDNSVHGGNCADYYETDTAGNKFSCANCPKNGDQTGCNTAPVYISGQYLCKRGAQCGQAVAR